MTSIAISRVHFPVTTLGPRRRLGIWMQGCSIRCPGCISADTWATGRGVVALPQLLCQIAPWLDEAEGITRRIAGLHLDALHVSRSSEAVRDGGILQRQISKEQFVACRRPLTEQRAVDVQPLKSHTRHAVGHRQRVLVIRRTGPMQPRGVGPDGFARHQPDVDGIGGGIGSDIEAAQAPDDVGRGVRVEDHGFIAPAPSRAGPIPGPRIRENRPRPPCRQASSSRGTATG